MRWFIIPLLFALLAGLTVSVWNHRYTRDDLQPALSLRMGEGNDIVISKKPEERPIVFLYPLKELGACGALHLKMNHFSNRLMPGDAPWKAGRCMIEWADKAGDVRSRDTFLTFTGTDQSMRHSETVVRCASGHGYPVLRIEHLGESGEMILEGLRVTAVVERAGHRWWIVSVVLLWFGFLVMWVAGFGIRSVVRIVPAAMVLLAMGWFLAVPGPWAHPRPLSGQFLLGKGRANNLVLSISHEDMKKAKHPEPLGKMPVQGSWLYQVKRALSLLRPVLHAMMFAGPAMVLAVLVGYRCGWWSMVFMSILVEIAQACFWFGFDWVDGLDLLLDWLGVLGSLWVLMKIKESNSNHPMIRLCHRMMPPTPQSAT